MPAAISYANDIQPLWSRYCVECHDGAGVTPLNLKQGNSYNEIIKGGYIDRVKFIPQNSKIYRMVNDGDMPDDGTIVPQEEIQKIADWIKQGGKNN
ncbi:MAG: cytochrome c [Bacteroidales bacterium]|nr:cytochrome c [Bacteroidales bacterium]